MAAEGGGDIVRFIYTGAEGERILDEATHITVAESCTFVRANAFQYHQNIVELICHEGVEKIEAAAFYKCPNLRRAIMPGVNIAESLAFGGCKALTDMECGKLEIIEGEAFSGCSSLTIINMPSARIVGRCGFSNCFSLMGAHFSRNLKRIEHKAFFECFSLERITLPLKHKLIAEKDVFMACENLNQIHLVEEAVLQETVAALREWRNDMNRVSEDDALTQISETLRIESIHQILPKARAGHYEYGADPLFAEHDPGQKARAIRWWIKAVLDKIVRCKAEHQRVLDGAATRLQLALPQDIVMNSVLPFLQLPSYTFVGEENYSLEVKEHEDEEREKVESNRCCCCIQ